MEKMDKRRRFFRYF